MTNRKSPMGFPTSCRWSAYVNPKSPKGFSSKSDLLVFKSKFQFQSKKVCYKVSLSDNFQRQCYRAVNQLWNNQKIHVYGLKVFPSTWTIGSNWPTPLLHQRVCHSTLSRANNLDNLTSLVTTALLNNVTSKIECGQLHSEHLGRRHSTLQSHGLFALAKRLFLQSIAFYY